MRHLGPISQDFHCEFQIGKDYKTIAAVNADGVALAAIQTLNDQVEVQADRIAELEQIDLLVSALSGRRRDCSLRPPTPPYERFRIRRFCLG